MRRERMPQPRGFALSRPTESSGILLLDAYAHPRLLNNGESMSEECPKCDGKGIMPFSIGWAKCSACGGCGKNSEYRKRRAAENKADKMKVYNEKKAEVEELELAVKQFEPRTNLDGVIKLAIENLLDNKKLHLGLFLPARMKYSRHKKLDRK